MTQRSLGFRQFLLQMTSLSGVVMLAACGNSHNVDIGESFTELATGQRSLQAVEGERHVPPENPLPSAMPAGRQAPPAAADAAQTNNSPPSYAKDPYDYYDTSGNRVTPAVSQNAAGDQPQEDFFSHMFGSITGNAPAKKDEWVRKPLPGNPPMSTAQAAPSSAPSQAAAPVALSGAGGEMAEPAETKQQAAWLSRPMDKQPDSANNKQDETTASSDAAAHSDETPTPMVAPPVPSVELSKESVAETEPASPAEAKAKSTWLSRLFGSSSGASSDDQSRSPKESRESPDNMNNVLSTQDLEHATDASAQQAAEPQTAESQAAGNAEAPSPSVQKPSWFGRLLGEGETEDMPEQTAPIPKLSSVPQTPPAFQSVKSAKQEDTQELQTERDTAQQEKQSLDAEPSQQQPMTPVEMPPAKAAASVLPVPQENNPPGNVNEPVLLGHASALPPPALATVPPANEPAPAEPPAAGTPPETKDAIATEKEEPAPAAEAPAPATEAKATEAAADSQPSNGISSLLNGLNPFSSDAQQEPQQQDNQANTAATTPVPPVPEKPAGTPLPTFVPAAAAVTSVTASDQPQATADNTAGDNTASSLPSPQILQQVRVLPPSRYSARQQSLQSQQPSD